MVVIGGNLPAGEWFSDVEKPVLDIQIDPSHPDFDIKLSFKTFKKWYLTSYYHEGKSKRERRKSRHAAKIISESTVGHWIDSYEVANNTNPRRQLLLSAWCIAGLITSISDTTMNYKI